jgi:hypothetical protein
MKNGTLAVEDMDREPPSPLRLQELALVGWLCERPAARFAVVTGSDEHARFKLYERTDRLETGAFEVVVLTDYQTGKEADEAKAAFGGNIRWNSGALVAAGHVRKSDHGRRAGDDFSPFEQAFKDVPPSPEWPDGSHYVILSGAPTMFWWQSSGRSLYEAMLEDAAERQAQAAARRRKGVFGKVMGYDRKAPEHLIDELPQGMEIPLPRLNAMRPLCTAEIVRETTTRFIVKNVEPFDRNTVFTSSLVAKRLGDETYVERDHLMIDWATNEDVEEVRAFDEAKQREHDERCRKAAAEIVPIMKANLERDAEEGHRHLEGLTRLLAAIKSRRTNAAE